MRLISAISILHIVYRGGLAAAASPGNGGSQPRLRNRNTDSSANSKQEDPNTPIKVLVRLDRQSKSRRQSGINAFRHASVDTYLDASYINDADIIPSTSDGNNDPSSSGSPQRAPSPLRGIMAASMTLGRMNGLISSGLFELVEVDNDVEALGWMDAVQPYDSFEGRVVDGRGNIVSSKVEGVNDSRDNQNKNSERFLQDDTEEIPWGIPFVQGQNISDHPTNKIRVCVADTGMFLGHEDLPFCDRDDATCKDVVNGTDGAMGSWSVDGHGHGTHCSGTVGAIGSNSKGVVGVFSDSSKWSLEVGKALGASGSGTGGTVMAAVQACVDNGAKVISLSLGCTSEEKGTCWSQSEEDFYAELYENHDVLLVAAAGNSGNNKFSYPASYPPMMSVAAVDVNDNLASFSQYNSQVEIAGPGVGVRSTVPAGCGSGCQSSYTTWSGTSMATPHVAAVAAKVWSYFPACKNWQIRNALNKAAFHREDNTTDASYCDMNRGHGDVQLLDTYTLLDDGGCGAGGISKDGDGTPGANMLGGCDQVYETLPPTTSPAPTQSWKPSSAPSDQPTPFPTSSHQPSFVPSQTQKPSQSPSDRPSGMPSFSTSPSLEPTDYPTYSPTDDSRVTVNSPASDNFQIQHGVMFDIKAKNDILITNLNITLYTTVLTNVTIWTKLGSFWNEKNYEPAWNLSGFAQNVKGTGNLDLAFVLPRHSLFAPIAVAAGQTMAFYISIPSDDTGNRVAMDNQGTNLHGVWFENEDMSCHEGIFKSNWGHYAGAPLDTYRFAGGFLYLLDGTRNPTPSPTVSAKPSSSLAPSRSTDKPTVAPSTSVMPTGEALILSTPSAGSSYASAYGYMFDLVSKRTADSIRVLNFDLFFKVPKCDFMVFTKLGPSAYGYDVPEFWTLIGSGTLEQDAYYSTKLHSLSSQLINPGETRSYYIAFVDCYGSAWPLAVDRGTNHSTGVWVEDDHLKLMEGLKKHGGTPSNPFGSDSYVCQPGGCSHNMRGSKVLYSVVSSTPFPSRAPVKPPTPSPSTSPSKSPTMQPTASPSRSPNKESQSPTSSPTSAPSEAPSNSPSQAPTNSPTSAPSKAPSNSPSHALTENPTSSPSKAPSSSPSKNPTMSPMAPGICSTDGTTLCTSDSDCCPGNLFNRNIRGLKGKAPDRKEKTRKLAKEPKTPPATSPPTTSPTQSPITCQCMPAVTPSPTSSPTPSSPAPCGTKNASCSADDDCCGTDSVCVSKGGNLKCT